MTNVVNLYILETAYPSWVNDPQYVYIGRTFQGLTGEWGNPFAITASDNRADVIRKYILWISLKIIGGKDNWRNKIKALRGKTLVCFCAPKLCHGHILALLADTL